jgi:hypothetical protein
MLIFLAWSASILLRGLTLMLLWKWFIVPLGAPEINIFHSLGIAMLLVYIFFDVTKKVTMPWSQIIINSIVTSLSLLLIGFLLSLGVQ